MLKFKITNVTILPSIFEVISFLLPKFFFCYSFGRLRCHQHLIQTHFVNNTIRVNFGDRNVTLVYSVLTNMQGLKFLHIDCSLFGIAGFLFLHLCNFSSPCKKVCEFSLETQNHNSLNTHSSHSIRARFSDKRSC